MSHKNAINTKRPAQIILLILGWIILGHMTEIALQNVAKPYCIHNGYIPVFRSFILFALWLLANQHGIMSTEIHREHGSGLLHHLFDSHAFVTLEATGSDDVLGRRSLRTKCARHWQMKCLRWRGHLFLKHRVIQPVRCHATFRVPYRLHNNTMPLCTTKHMRYPRTIKILDFATMTLYQLFPLWQNLFMGLIIFDNIEYATEQE